MRRNVFAPALLSIIAVSIVLYSAYLAFAFAKQPPLDMFAFRQAQTALTAYWFNQEGFRFGYETPVGGAPWSIPFEFPIYQFIVSCLSKFLHISLDVAGRVTSYFFLVLCILPVRSITKRLRLPDAVLLIFIALVFSAPIYVYWGRTFMIETAALFFSVVAIDYFLVILLAKPSWITIFSFVIFISLAILQKATTGLPVLAVLSAAFFFSELRKARSIQAFVFSKSTVVGCSCFIVPLAIGLSWVWFTDRVKLGNPLGAQLTSTALSPWNWGTLSQRLSADFWVQVIWQRIMVTNMGSSLGLFLLVSPFLVRGESKLKTVMVGSLALGVLPLFLFTNLHIIHEYYQTANFMFLGYALAVALAGVVLPAIGEAAAVFVLLLVVCSNYAALNSGYLPQIQTVFGKDNRDLAIGEILKRELAPQMQFVAFGNDWSSTFAYISQRKSFTVPRWFSRYDEVVANPERFVDKDSLGAVVSCSNESPNISDLSRWAGEGRSWKIGETNGCLILTPEKPFDSAGVVPGQCLGNFDVAEVVERDGHKLILFAGWTTAAAAGARLGEPSRIFLILTSRDHEPIYLEALKVPRPDVNRYLGIPKEIDAGFSRLVPANLTPGNYEVEIVQYSGDQYRSCQHSKKLLVKN